MYVFGDSISTTTNNVTGSTNYFGERYCNGPVWVEILAQRQGIPFYGSNNISFFGNNSAELTNLTQEFVPPSDADTSLFVVWVSAGDIFLNYLLNSTNAAAWTDAISSAMTNTLQSIQNLYAKGARIFVMPNVVDISQVPLLSAQSSSDKAFLRARCLDYNAAFTGMLNQARAALTDATIYEPDLFGQFDSLLTDPAAYGLVNPGVDALSDTNIPDKSFNGPGANYVFWDSLHPTSKVHELLADGVQQILSPLRIGGLIRTGNTNHLMLVNLPIGKTGVLESGTNFTSWTTNVSISATGMVQSLDVLANDPYRFYRLKF